MGAYSGRMIKGRMCVWLQDCGWQPAKLGKELKVGDVLVCNYGYREEIISIDKETAKTLVFTVRTERGEIYSGIRIGKDTFKPVSD
jgi:hypothetical protein